MTSTPEQRIERGVYDSSTDYLITDEMRERAAESHGNAIQDVRGMIDNQINTLVGDSLDSHFALQAILAGMLSLRQQENNG